MNCLRLHHPQLQVLGQLGHQAVHFQLVAFGHSELEINIRCLRIPKGPNSNPCRRMPPYIKSNPGSLSPATISSAPPSQSRSQGPMHNRGPILLSLAQINPGRLVELELTA